MSNKALRENRVAQNRALDAAPPTDEERKVLRKLGNIASEFNELAAFSDGHGITSRQTGGLWGSLIPINVLRSMAAKGWLCTEPNGDKVRYKVTWYGYRAAAMVYYDIPYTTDGI